MSVKRKIEAMHERFGSLPGKRCEECSNLIQGKYHGIHLRKCTVYGATHSAASDWRKKYWATHKEQKEHALRTGLAMRNEVALEEANKRRSVPIRYNGKEYMSVRAASRAEGRAQATIKKHGEVMQ